MPDSTFNAGIEKAARVVDKFTNSMTLAEKLPWLESPITFANVMKEISKAIRELKEPT